MKLQFCGAAGTVTGSSHLLTLDDGFTILLDCGLYQGKDKDFDDFNGSWYFEPSKIDLVILSHAHIDHSGRLPKLVKDGFKGGIFGKRKRYIAHSPSRFKRYHHRFFRRYWSSQSSYFTRPSSVATLRSHHLRIYLWRQAAQGRTRRRETTIRDYYGNLR